ncbi:hypothetical protein EJB05_28069, partial [Eragrostis curvula]
MADSQRVAGRGACEAGVRLEADEGGAPARRAAGGGGKDGDGLMGERSATGGEGSTGPVTSKVNFFRVKRAVNVASLRGVVRDVAPVMPEPKSKADGVGALLLGRDIGRSSSGHGTGRIPVGKDLGPSRELAMAEENGKTGVNVSCRKRKLLSSGIVSEVRGPPNTKQKVDTCETSSQKVASQQSAFCLGMPENAEALKNSSDSTKETPADPCSPVKAVELPPSSGDIDVPEEAISYLFSVYNFLRSFSVKLFLSPFGLHDFVGAINCTEQNNLLDAVHVSLLRALRWHLEIKSAEGSRLASNCLKYLDWTLLDALTWPTFLLVYLYVMRCIKNLGLQSLGRKLLAVEYYKLPIVMKLRVMQILCDHLTDSGGYSEMEHEADSSLFPETRSRAVSTTATKASGYQSINAVAANASENVKSDDCRICGMGGTLVTCDGCTWAYHSRCIGLYKAFLPKRQWFCPECVVDKLGQTLSKTECGARGTQRFGVDVCGRLFLGSCNYLLVIGTSSNAESYERYYNHYDVVKVLQILALSDTYTDICRRILGYWKHLLDFIQSERSKTSKQTLSGQNSIHTGPINGASGPNVVSSASHHNQSFVSDVSNNAPVQPAQSLFRPVLSTSVSGHNGISSGDMASTCSTTAESVSPSYQSKQHFQLIAERSGTMSGSKQEKIVSFKPQAYMNLYTHGNIAASAAASIAILKKEEGKVSSSQYVAKARKKMAADNALEWKAFSSTATHFVWPSAEKKLTMEVPRDRCGWCLACRTSTNGNKKACVLNMASANNAIGSPRGLSTMHLIIKSDSHFTSVVSYLVNMEECLHGLLIGSLQHKTERQRWHKQLQAASNYRAVVPLLLELEKNIRGVAFSASWSKLIDDWPVESPGVSTGRLGRKRLLAYESGMATDDDINWAWWSGGNISNRILQRGFLLCSSMRKAARQGGKKRIGSISYHEDSNLPRCTRQFAWRACVELSNTSSQLALQIRYLDAHIRWKEFVPTDQIPSCRKSPTDADFAFRNAVICDRKIVDNRIRYRLKFPNQKHHPLWVRKNILEAEDTEEENSNLWFSENNVPLYMVQQFEQRAGISSLSTPAMLDVNSLTNFCTRRGKAFVGDVFLYLFQKGDAYPCTSCKKDVPFRVVVKCSSCQGNCHKECTSSSIDSNKGSNAASSLICKLCLQKRSLMLARYSTNASYIQPQHMIPGQQLAAASKIILKVGPFHYAAPAMEIKTHPVAKVQFQPCVKVDGQPIMNVKGQSTAKVEAQLAANVKAPKTSSVPIQQMSKGSKSEKRRIHKNVQSITYFGLVWKKYKAANNDGRDFRENDLILKSKDGIGSSVKPVCCLCNKTYSPDLLYVRCQKCRNWFHGDALQLEEEKTVELVAYCCCRCRKRGIPHCPHSDDQMKPETSKQTVAISSHLYID